MSEYVCKVACDYQDGVCVSPSCPGGTRRRILELEAERDALREIIGRAKLHSDPALVREVLAEAQHDE